MKRKKGSYKVCHPFSMCEETIGYWNGKWWVFKDTGKDSYFEDDDLNWIKEEQYQKKKGGDK